MTSAIEPGAPPRRRPEGLRRWRRLALFVAAVLALQAGGGWLVDHLWFEVWPWHSRMLDVAAAGVALVYVTTMAMPFVPGIEIGLAVMLTFGRSAIVAVYVCTQIALLLSFVVGRLAPPAALIRLTGWLRLIAFRDLLLRLEPMTPSERLGYMLRRAPRRWVQALVAHRYLALAVLINLPGNAIVGGAGGIGLLAGMSRIVTLPRYVLTMAIATTPVPLALWLGGMG